MFHGTTIFVRIPGAVALGLFLSLSSFGYSQELRVRDVDGLRRAAREAKPGTSILLEPGTYQGPVWLDKLRGQAGRPIVIRAADPSRPPVILGAQECIHISEATHLELRDLTLRSATGNGLNIDDGGSYDTPAQHITLRRLRVSDIGPSGNRDAIKLSGLDDFLIEECVIERWGSGGSGIDMVGCHRGRITNCEFREGGSEAVQCKGGTSSIRIDHCRFVNYGGRGVNIGGSTGFEFFRPKLETIPAGSRYEGKEITVEECLFTGGQAPVAFVGVDGAVVRRCTIYRPGRWALRILQETRAPEFVKSRNGVFEDNIVVFQSGSWAESGVNIGPNTAPETFRFARNVWYCEDAPQRSKPTLPATEQDGLYGKDPLFVDAQKGDFRLKPGSPAVGRGAFPGNSGDSSRAAVPDQAWFPKASPLPPPPADALRVGDVQGLYAAAKNVRPGGTIVVAEGVYRLTRPLELSTDRVTLRGTGERGRTVLDGGNMGELVKVSACSDVLIADLMLQNVMWNGLKINSETGVQRLTVRNCVFHNIWQRAIKGVKVPAANRNQVQPRGFTIEHCLFYNDHAKRYEDDTADTAQTFGGNYIGGIDVMYARDWVIRDNVFIGIKGRSGIGRGAVFIWHESIGCVVERNVVIDCDSGICMGNSYKPDDVAVHCTGSTVRNNMLSRVPENGIFMAWTRDCRVGHNTVWDPESKKGRLIRAAHDNPGLLVSNNLLIRAPLRDESTPPVKQSGNLVRSAADALAAPAQGDLHLKQSAPGMASQPLDWVTEDFDRQKRGAAVEVGADDI